MARQTLVLDASVGVKWFSDKGETALRQALSIRDAHIAQEAMVVVPDFFHYEVSNAIIHKKSIPTSAAQSAVVALFALGLRTISIDTNILASSVKIARQFNITVYDACYMAVALRFNCPLVTANPRHQEQAFDCQVIPIEQWQRASPLSP